MNAFIREYEEQCGNISVACWNTGITRRTYYRWMTGTARLHLRFQRKIARIEPQRVLLDAAQKVVMNKLAANDLDAAKFTLARQGKSNGWSDRIVDTVEVPAPLVTQIADAYLAWVKMHPGAKIEDKMRWLGLFAEKGKVPPAELQAAVEGKQKENGR